MHYFMCSKKKKKKDVVVDEITLPFFFLSFLLSFTKYSNEKYGWRVAVYPWNEDNTELERQLTEEDPQLAFFIGVFLLFASERQNRLLTVLPSIQQSINACYMLSFCTIIIHRILQWYDSTQRSLTTVFVIRLLFKQHNQHIVRSSAWWHLFYSPPWEEPSSRGWWTRSGLCGSSPPPSLRAGRRGVAAGTWSSPRHWCAVPAETNKWTLRFQIRSNQLKTPTHSLRGRLVPRSLWERERLRSKA